MDSFEINKIVAAVLMVALLVIGIGKLSDVIFHVEKPETPGYKVEVDQVSTASSSTTTTAEELFEAASVTLKQLIANNALRNIDTDNFKEKFILRLPVRRGLF